MHRAFVLRVSLALMVVTGCASQRETGAALVGTGLVVAVVTAEAATGQRVVTSQGYAASTSRNGGAAAVGVGAGVALAAAGAALAENAPDDAPRAGRAGTAPSGGWRLVRPAETAGSLDPE
jgi:hypothetical protein